MKYLFCLILLAGCVSVHQPEYIDFIDDYNTVFVREMKAGDTLYYTIDSGFKPIVKKWIHEAMTELDEIVPIQVKQGTGEHQFKFIIKNDLGHAGGADTQGRIYLPENITANTSGGYYRGPGTVRHEIGHALGLSHPDSEDGIRPDDWCVDDPICNGMNTMSDANVTGPDGHRLDCWDTVMAFAQDADVYRNPQFKWMDEATLQSIYGGH